MAESLQEAHVAVLAALDAGSRSDDELVAATRLEFPDLVRCLLYLRHLGLIAEERQRPLAERWRHMALTDAGRARLAIERLAALRITPPRRRRVDPALSDQPERC